MNFTSFFKNLIENSQQRTHTTIIKEFSKLFFIWGGRNCCEFVQANLGKALPSACQVERYISNNGTLFEGQFRFEELLMHLEQYNVSHKMVALSEGATKLVQQINYDPATNQCVGFVLKLTKDGIPECKKYLFTAFETVKNYMLNLPRSSYVYTIMAQPLKNNVPPICLAVIGIDNKFTASNIASRWQ